MILESISSIIKTADFADVLSIIAILITSIVAYKSYRLSKNIAVRQAKPILTIYTAEYNNLKALTLVNVGVGTAIIKSVKMRKDDKQSQCVADLFDLNMKLKWDTFWRFQQTKDYIQAGERRRLSQLSKNDLIAQKCTEKESEEIIKRWQEKLEGIQIEIEYEDVFGNSQPKYFRIFRS